jgi:hypothetical protein
MAAIAKGNQQRAKRRRGRLNEGGGSFTLQDYWITAKYCKSWINRAGLTDHHASGADL